MEHCLTTYHGYKVIRLWVKKWKNVANKGANVAFVWDGQKHGRYMCKDFLLPFGKCRKCSKKYKWWKVFKRCRKELEKGARVFFACPLLHPSLSYMLREVLHDHICEANSYSGHSPCCVHCRIYYDTRFVKTCEQCGRVFQNGSKLRGHISHKSCNELFA